jgi:CRISPR-associated protein Cmx8
MAVKAGKPKKQKALPVEVLELDYQLAELPSSQHRAGLAGLVLMVKHLERQGTNKGICELSRIDEQGATLRINRAGLESLFDVTYAAVRGERESNKKAKKAKTKEEIPPLRDELREVSDPKTGGTKTVTVYIYPTCTPRGAFLVEYDPTANDAGDGLWVKLWRDMVWSILRKKPTTRTPYTARADRKQTKDAGEAWEALLKPSHHAVDLPSTYYIGARAANAEMIPFKDRARLQFLLHFWSFVAQIYVPAVMVLDKEMGSKLDLNRGYALAVPDVARLQTFCAVLPKVLEHGRGTERTGYRPRDGVVTVAAEGALDLYDRLTRQLALQASGNRASRLVLGIDVIHVAEAGDDVIIKSTSRIEPDMNQTDEYARVRTYMWNPLFRRQRVLNILSDSGRPWYAGFDSLLTRTPHELGFSADTFSHDAKESFKYEENLMDENDDAMPPTRGDTEDGADESAPPPHATCEVLVYKVVGNYLSRKLKSKHELEWKDVAAGTVRKQDYYDARRKLSRDAFFAVRSRTGEDFVDYFASTLCSVPQNLREEHFALLARDLHDYPDKVRTLTMLALSARG